MPVSEPLPTDAGQLRFVKACLNRLMGTRLQPRLGMTPATRSALRAFQRQNGLPVTGLLDAATDAALGAACSASPPETAAAPAAPPPEQAADAPPADGAQEPAADAAGPAEPDAGGPQGGGEGEFGDFLRQIGQRASDAAGAVGQALRSLGDAGIVDLTAQADKTLRKGTRDPKTVYALVLHQMACCFRPKDPLKRFLTINSHFAITADGRILQLHPVSALLWASNGFNARSVAVEFAGNFPNTKGAWWQGEKFGRDRPTRAQFEAGRRLVRHLQRTLGLTHVLAHRQSSGTRENDPGPDLWRQVGQWAVDALGLKDGGPGFKIGTGNPIPDEWRTWGGSGVSPEIGGPIAGEVDDEALAHDVWQGETHAASPEFVRWIHGALNRALDLRLPVSGVASPAMRSAVRRFQARNGLPVSGIVGTDTEQALRDAAGEQPAGEHAEAVEYESLGPLEAELRWLPDNADPKPYTRAEAMKVAGGGVYIAVHRKAPATDVPLKVGVTNRFKVRLAYYATPAKKLGDVRFYLAHISRGRIGGTGIAGVDKAIEYAIARTLLRAGQSLAWHKLPKSIASVVDTVEIKNMLPKPLAAVVSAAFTASGKDPRGQPIRTYSAPAASDPFRLVQPTHPQWEARP